MKTILAVIILVAGIGCNDKDALNQAADASHYRGVVKTVDGKSGMACSVIVGMMTNSGDYLELNSIPAKVGEQFDGTFRPVTSGAVDLRLRFTARCEGYADQQKEVTWSVSPDKGKQLDLGELILSPSTDTNRVGH